MDHQDLFKKLSKSTFRSRFKLTQKDQDYVASKGKEVIQKHASEFVASRLSPAYIENDGKQTPMKGHPIFIGQHATATCCRGCLEKWHHIPQNRVLTTKEQAYIVDVLMSWIDLQMEDYKPKEEEKTKEYEQLTLF